MGAGVEAFSEPRYCDHFDHRDGHPCHCIHCWLPNAICSCTSHIYYYSWYQTLPLLWMGWSARLPKSVTFFWLVSRLSAFGHISLNCLECWVAVDWVHRVLGGSGNGLLISACLFDVCAMYWIWFFHFLPCSPLQLWLSLTSLWPTFLLHRCVHVLMSMTDQGQENVKAEKEGGRNDNKERERNWGQERGREV